MGLDIVCRGTSVRVGSYSGVHLQRIGFLRAEALRLREEDRHEEADRVLACIRSASEIHYDLVRGLEKVLLPGTYAFVYHSDCDGSWDADDAAAILEALGRFRLFLRAIPEFKHRLDGKDRYYLEDILSLSVRTGEFIYFM